MRSIVERSSALRPVLTAVSTLSWLQRLPPQASTPYHHMDGPSSSSTMCNSTLRGGLRRRCCYARCLGGRLISVRGGAKEKIFSPAYIAVPTTTSCSVAIADDHRRSSACCTAPAIEWGFLDPHARALASVALLLSAPLLAPRHHWAAAAALRTTLRTWRPAVGAERVVLAGEAAGGGALFCTTPPHWHWQGSGGSLHSALAAAPLHTPRDIER